MTRNEVSVKRIAFWVMGNVFGLFGRRESVGKLAWMDGLRRPAVVGVVHVGALPGTLCGRRSVSTIAEQAVREAMVLFDGGVNAIILENMHDVPYLNRQVGPEITAAMTAVCTAVRRALDNVSSAARFPMGVQVLAGANREAIAVAHAADCQFVRCEGYVFAHVADEGLMTEADAGPLLRYRRAIGAEQIAILADVKKKHASHAITSDVDLAETCKAAAFFGADGVIITGIATGTPTAAVDVQAAKSAVRIPVFVGSGVTIDDAGVLGRVADGLIVGTTLKHEGRWENEVEPARIRGLVAAARQD